MTIYSVRRVSARGEVNYSKTFETYRKAINAVGRLQEKSSKSSTIHLLENDRVIDTSTGLV